MPHNAKAVANYFLQRGEAEQIPITPMKLQKLVYYAHGSHLAVLDAPLINEQIECWKYGPVIRSLFHEFKAFGSDPITCRASVNHFEEDGSDPLTFRAYSTTPTMDDANGTTLEILDEVWSAYSQYSGVRLSNMTHLPGTPWSQVMDEYKGNPLKGTDIPNRIIRDYFRLQMDKSQ